MDKLYDTKQEILEVINKIDDNRYREVLTARYISFQKFKKIAKCMNYDERHIYRIHHAALNEAEKFINKK